MCRTGWCAQFVDDVEFWFPPGKRSLVEYRSASRSGQIDFGFNRKRIKVCWNRFHFCSGRKYQSFDMFHLLLRTLI